MNALERICQESSGARFYRADLHIHSFGASHDVQDTGMTPSAIIATAQAENLSVIALADHNEITNVGAAIAAAQGSSVLVIPAVELSTPQGHLLCYLPTPEALQSFVGRLSIADRGTQSSRCQTALLDCLELLQQFGGFGVLAHVDAPSGFEVEVPGGSPHKYDVLCHPGLLGIELRSAQSDISYSPADPDSTRQDIGQKRIERLALGEKQFLARVLNSDSHTLASLGRNAQGARRLTRLKMEIPTFAALRLALEDADARVRLEDEIPQSIPHVLGVFFDGGFLDGQTVHLSRNLNCIIGGRGTGKSTAFEAIRLLSGEEGGPVVDSEIWPAGLYLCWRDASGAEITLFRPTGGELSNVDDPVLGASQFDMDSFGQGETAKISYQAQTNPAALLGYLDRFVDLAGARSEETRERNLLLELQTKIEEAQQNVDLIPQYERSLNVTQQQLATIEKTNAKEVIALQRKVAEERAIRDQIATEVGTLKSEVASVTAIDRIKRICAVGDPSQLQVGGTELKAILDGAIAFQAAAGDASTKLQDEYRVFNEAVVAQLAAWKAKEAVAVAAIEVKRKELEAQNIRLDMAYIQKLAADEASYRQWVANLHTWKPVLGGLRKERAQVLARRWKARERTAMIRDAFARGASDVLKMTLTDLQVSLKFVRSGLCPDAEQLIIDTMGWRTTQVPRAALLVQSLTIPILLEAIRSKDAKAITTLKFPDGVAAFDGRDAVAIFEKLGQSHVMYALERADIQDLPRLTVTGPIARPGQPPQFVTRDFSKLSLGQQQSVLLALMLSADTNQPLIIDQPEDNLDSEFIYHTLIPVLRRAKERRQIIIVTHNANIAVLGDAEQIIVLKSGNERGQIVARGSIDCKATRDFACNILEGAREAFQRRGKTYGYRLERLQN